MGSMEKEGSVAKSHIVFLCQPHIIILVRQSPFILSCRNTYIVLNLTDVHLLAQQTAKQQKTFLTSHHKVIQQRPQQHFWLRRQSPLASNPYPSQYGERELNTWSQSRGVRSAATNSAQPVSEKMISLRYIISTKLAITQFNQRTDSKTTALRDVLEVSLHRCNRWGIYSYSYQLIALLLGGG